MAFPNLPLVQIHLAVSIGAFICLHCQSAPTALTLNHGPSSQPACRVLLNVNVIHDSTCLQNDFQEKALVLGNHHIKNEEAVRKLLAKN